MASNFCYDASTNNLFYTGGKVGIEVEVPTEKLDVAGNIKASGTVSGSNISGSGSQSGTNTGDVTIAAVGAATATGASLSGQALSLTPADSTHPGIVTTGTQTIAGNKTFSGTVTASNLSNTNSGDVTLGAVGSAPSANAATLSSQVLTLQPADATHPGVVTTGAQVWAGDKTLTGSTTLSGILAANGAVSLIDAKPNSVANGTGINAVDNGRTTSGWLKVTVDKTAWTAADVTQDVTLCVIPAKMRVLAVYADTTVKYAGLADTITLMVGTTTGGVEVLAEHDVKTAPVTAGLLDADLGTSMVRAAQVQGGYLPSWTGTTNVKVRLTSGTGNIGDGAGATNLTTGSTTYYLKLELP